MSKWFCSLAALISFGPALASTPRLENPVTYHPSAGVDQTVRTECQIESMLVRHVGDQLKRVYRTEDVLVDKGGEAAGRPVLRLQITHVLGVGGGAWSGPKAITVSAELVGNDGQVRQTKINRWSVGGMWGGFKGTCSILDRCAVSIGKDLARWVKDPSFKIKEMPAPKESGVPSQPVGANEAAAIPSATGSAVAPAQAAPMPEDKGAAPAPVPEGSVEVPQVPPSVAPSAENAAPAVEERSPAVGAEPPVAAEAPAVTEERPAPGGR